MIGVWTEFGAMPDTPLLITFYFLQTDGQDAGTTPHGTPWFIFVQFETTFENRAIHFGITNFTDT